MNLEFHVTITTDRETGEPLCVYFQIRSGKVHETREFSDGAAFADYDAHGHLLGVELLSPCRVTIVDQLAANESPELRQRTKRFMRENGPRFFVAA